MTEAEKVRLHRQRQAAERTDLPEGLASLANMTAEQLDIIEREKAKSYVEGQKSVGWWRTVVGSLSRVIVLLGLLGGAAYLVHNGTAGAAFEAAKAGITEFMAEEVPAELPTWEHVRDIEGGTIEELQLDEETVCYRQRGGGMGLVSLGCTGVKKVPR